MESVYQKELSMSNNGKWDLARQVATVVGALFQVLAPAANGQNPLLQRVGWFLAGAFFLNGLWEVLVPLRQPVVPQALLAGIFACLVVGYVRLVRSEGSVWNRANRWLVALPLGLLFGWITAANVVSFNDTLVELGLLGNGVGGALAGAFLLLVGAVLASVVILLSGAALLSGALVAMAIITTLSGRRPHIGASRSVRPRAAGGGG